MHFRVLIAATILVAVDACESDESGDANPGPGSGGASDAGESTGGSARSSGGRLGSGGKVESGGARSSGGADSGSGGATSTGGVAPTGGATAADGSTSAGGENAGGGTPNTGGTTPTGGSPNTDGSIGTGGTPSTGGASNTGGAGGSSGTNPSCAGLAPTCGPAQDRDCCASSLVPGGTFDRSDYAPATLSDFRLDTYEVSVGRFRRFVAEYSQSMIASGAGKNSSDAADPGWDTTWNASLPVDRAALIAGVKCNAPYQTWTDSSGGNENRPIDCVTWYEALAFCIWDGGRLPTEAEWNYSAAGGSEQRQYPWSNPPSSTTIDCAHANYGGLNPTATTCVLPGTGSANGVGSESPVGDGRWGHADLSGNVWEWTIDWYVVPYPSPCTNCAERSPATFRVNRGGSFLGDAAGLLSSSRNITAPSDRVATGGARCARAP